MYCTVAEARAAGATGTDGEVEAAIGTARVLIDRYTGSVWEPTPALVVAIVAPDGSALLPWPVRAIESVTVVGSPVALPDGAWRALSSLTRGQVDAVLVGAGRAADILVVGAEPWRGGYAALLSGALGGTGQVEVLGTFGPDHPPVEVRDAAAALAAWRQKGGTLLPVTGPDTDDEGNVVSVTVNMAAAPVRSRTTGLPGADALLAPLIRSAVLVS